MSETLSRVEQLLQSVDKRLTVAAYAQAAREIRLIGPPLCPVRVSLLSTFTIDPLVPFLEVEAARSGFAAAVYLGPFNAVQQELLDPGSGCLIHQPDVVFVAQLLDDVCPPLAHDFLVLNGPQTEQYVEEVIAETVASLLGFRQLSRAPVVLHNFALRPYPSLGLYEVAAPGSQTQTIRRLNARLVDAVKTVPGVHVLDYDRLCSEVGYLNCHDDKMWYLGRAPLSAEVLPALARVQAAFVQAICGIRRKCLVLDLDNTLWGGVVGENGIAGIKLGHTYPGNAFRYFQQVVLQLYRRGVLLAINSKNNQADAEEVFQSHPDMVLKPEHFASARINWRDKPENMVEIADELNIGLESLVFFDDNPAERALMRQALPQVLTLEVPPDPIKYSQVLLESSAFDSLSFTTEDRRRGAIYQEQKARHQMEQSATSLQDFLSSLDMAISIGLVDTFAFPRVLDLIQKTNQFNLTTRRHSASQVTEMIADPMCGVFSLRVTDRFGDNGIVGVAIVQAQGAIAFLDTFLLSCRVIGRTAETAFLSFLVDWVRTRGLLVMEGEFIHSAKNAPAADFYASHGFTLVSTDGAESRWRLWLDDVPFQWPCYIRLANEGRNNEGCEQERGSLVPNGC